MGGVFLLLLIGIGISQFYSDKLEPSHWHNWFHYRNGFCMAVYISIGYFLKKFQIVERYGLKIGIIYCVAYNVTYLMYILDVPTSQYLTAPNYTHYLVPNLSEVNGFLIIPSYLFYCTAGTVITFWVSQKIKDSKFLEYFGRTSLIIYCVHFTFLKLIINLLMNYLPTSGLISSFFFFIIVGTLTLALCVLIAMLFERRPFNYFIGKF